MTGLTGCKAVAEIPVKTTPKPSASLTVDQDRHGVSSNREKLWREMTQAGELLRVALDAEYQLMKLKQHDSPEQGLDTFRNCRKAVELCARNYAAAVRAWRLTLLDEGANADPTNVTHSHQRHLRSSFHTCTSS